MSGDAIAGLVPPRRPGDKRAMGFGHKLIGVARSAAVTMLAFALPPRCPGCRTITPDDHRFCLPCWMALDFIGSNACPGCGAPQELPLGGGRCGACLADPPAYDAMAAAVAYGPIARSIALRLKHGGHTGLAETVARQMARLADVTPDTLIMAVPLHRWRIWRRGYNQSALIARRLAPRTGGELALDLLRRDKPTPMLRGMGRAERARTVRGAFSVATPSRARVRGRPVLLVDDVFTTGATVDACARTLKRAGAASVAVITWARVNRKGVEDVDFDP